VKNRTFNVALLLLAGGAFLYGIAHLFALRFEAGDVFQPYSTLRGDPLGAKVFYDSLRTLPDVVVERNEKPLRGFVASETTTLFYLGTNTHFWREKDVQAFENVVAKGGRVVLSFHPQKKEEHSLAERPEKSPAKNSSPSPTPTPEEPTEKILDRDELAKRWKFQIQYWTDQVDSLAENQQIGSGLEREVPWHSAMYFAAVADPWRVVYAIGERAVIIEGRFGAGTVVLASDSYFISNEAMVTDRKPALLAWLAGNGRRLVFDETHHNVFENPGVANLLRKYRLHGLIAGLLLLTALFVWKSAASFLPRDRADDEANAMIAGRDAYSGFTNLLRRGLRPADLLGTCLVEWRKSFRHLAPDLERKLGPFADSAGDSREKLSATALVRRYEEITRTIDQSKWKRTPTA
jgi:hypothetical protein